MNDDLNTIEMPELEDFFNNHFIRVDERNRIVLGFSDAFDIPAFPAGKEDILINDKGGRHFRLILDGELTEENPIELMFNEQNVPLLKWDAKNKSKRQIATRLQKGKWKCYTLVSCPTSPCFVFT